MQFDQQYKNILQNIMENGVEEKNERTGHTVKALPGVSFSIDIEKEGFPLLSLRQLKIQTFVAEQIWFIQGNKSIEFLQKYTSIWDKFAVDGELETAYGYRWRHAFGRDQLANLIALLKKEPSSRHGVVITWDPARDGLGGEPKPNIPCPFTFTVNIIGGRLNLQNIVRSNDMVLGFPFDVAGFALLQCILAQELGVKPGVYSHFISNAHIYSVHYPTVEELLKRDIPQVKKLICLLPPNTFAKAREYDESIVGLIGSLLGANYTPNEPIRGLQLVL